MFGQNFVRVQDGHFFDGDEIYRFIGANYWYGMHLGSEAFGDRQRLKLELDQLAQLGIQNLRVMACGEGPSDAPWRVQPPLQPKPGVYEEQLLEGLDFLLSEMGKRKMRAIVCLNNFWPWTGGMAQYQSWTTAKDIPYPPPAEQGNWLRYMAFTANFYGNEAAIQLFNDHIRKIVSRINTINGLAYSNDPTIMSWQLANEPRGILSQKKYRKWIKSTAALIKSMDKNHLVSLGSEGHTSSKLAGNRFKKDHAFAQIDYTTIHIWVQNWMWYDPKRAATDFQSAMTKARAYYEEHARIAEELNKPMVLEEFGMARDEDDHDPQATTQWRDRYFREVFGWMLEENSHLAGCNFWAWAGSGRPRSPKTVWRVGDDYIGDPPHEYQGWYSVYDQDQSTLDLIQEFTRALK